MKTLVTYLGHCGYVVETENYQLVFDVIRGQIPHTNKKRIGFVTHGHADHYVESIYDDSFSVLVLSDDIENRVKQTTHVVKMGDELQIENLKLKVLGSTDLGCAYWVEVDNVKLFFSGDLNNWHWKTESTKEEVKEMNDWFLELLKPLENQEVDILFVDIDPRLKVDYDLGAKQMIELLHPRFVFPMHFASKQEEMNQYYMTTQIENLVKVNIEPSQFELDW